MSTLRRILLSLSALALSISMQAQPDTLSIVIGGDLMMHRNQIDADHHNFLRNIAYRSIEADLAIVNMEFTLGGKPYSGYPRFSAPDYMADYAVNECGFDVLLTANNHIIDRGSEGLARTLEIYRELGDSVYFTGSAGSKEEMLQNYPLIIEKKGVKLALINFTYATNGLFAKGWPNTNYQKWDEVKAAFERAKEQNADFIIALPHWGIEYDLRHSAEQQRWAEMMVDEGASIIVGGHPHVVQDTTYIKGVPVIYSLGNLVSNMSRPNTRIGLITTLRIVRDEQGLLHMLTPQLDFTWCTLPGVLEESHTTIFVDDYIDSPDLWRVPEDYDDMIATLSRIRTTCGLE